MIEVEGVSGLTLDHLDVTSDPPHILHPSEGILWIGTAQGQASNPSDMQITNNKIHDIGATGGWDHGIYGAGATTGGSAIIGNWIYDNAAFGFQLYPKATNLNLAYNIVDGNGALEPCSTAPSAPCPPSTTNGRLRVYQFRHSREVADDNGRGREVARPGAMVRLRTLLATVRRWRYSPNMCSPTPKQRRPSSATE